jgi:hypothetical protein
LVFPSTTFRAKAPAPEIATPVVPSPAAAEAPTATESIVGRDTRNVVVPPVTVLVIRKACVPETSCQTLPSWRVVSAGGAYSQGAAL